MSQSKNSANIETMNFEASFARLEAILERMNSNEISLDESLTLFEEADKLINGCSKKLNDAEMRIETLIKNRNGEIVIGGDQKPLSQPFDLSQQQTPPL